MAADLAAYRLDDIAFAGALHDPVAALAFCQPARVNHLTINGRVVVNDGRIATLDLPPLLERHNQLARELLQNG